MKKQPEVGEEEEYELPRPTDTPVYNIEDPTEGSAFEWRLDVFGALGLNIGLAIQLALRKDIERTTVEKLVERGCSEGLIYEILL